MKPGYTGVKRLFFATLYSIKGLKAAWRHESAFRQEIVLATFLVLLTFFLPVSKLEQLMMVASLVLVVIVELMNSAVEAVVDRIGSERHALSGRAKDMGSAAVFVSLLFVVFTWLLILI